MPYASFEEREYEEWLYDELLLGSERLLWTPGHVLERRIGVDAMLLVQDEFVFNLHGLGVRPGLVPSRHWWFFRHRLGVRRGRPLPSFAVNLFLQSKRPFALRAPKALAPHGISGRCWRFSTEADQQAVLEQLSAKFAGRALVAYAAPAFHTAHELFRSFRNSTMVARSTFPSASTLQGHDAWYYNAPGAVGVAHSDPTPAQEPDLLSRIKALKQHSNIGDDDDASWRRYLSSLARDVEQVLSQDTALPDARRALALEDLRRFRYEARDLPPDLAVPLTDYVTVAVMAAAFRLSWMVAG
jgi:hypothetical protein